MDPAVAAVWEVSWVVTSQKMRLGERHDITLLQLAAVQAVEKVQPQQPKEVSLTGAACAKWHMYLDCQFCEMKQINIH